MHLTLRGAALQDLPARLALAVGFTVAFPLRLLAEGYGWELPRIS